jgi:hypothetical protein
MEPASFASEDDFQKLLSRFPELLLVLDDGVRAGGSILVSDVFIPTRATVAARS